MALKLGDIPAKAETTDKAGLPLEKTIGKVNVWKIAAEPWELKSLHKIMNIIILLL